MTCRAEKESVTGVGNGSRRRLSGSEDKEKAERPLFSGSGSEERRRGGREELPLCGAPCRGTSRRQPAGGSGREQPLSQHRPAEAALAPPEGSSARSTARVPSRKPGSARKELRPLPALGSHRGNYRGQKAGCHVTMPAHTGALVLPSSDSPPNTPSTNPLTTHSVLKATCSSPSSTMLRWLKTKYR